MFINNSNQIKQKQSISFLFFRHLRQIIFLLNETKNGEVIVMLQADEQNLKHLNKHQMFFFKWIFLFCISCIGLFHTAQANTDSGANTSACKVKIEKIEVAKANPNQPQLYPTQGWVDVEKLPDRWEKRWPDYADVAWYKFLINYHCDSLVARAPISLAIESITHSGRVFINDELLWQDTITAKSASRSQYHPRIWNLPASSLKQGQNTLWIQTYGSITQNSGIGHVIIGTDEEVKPKYNIWRLEMSLLVQLSAMINVVIGVLYFLSWLANRKEKAFFWIAVTCFGWVIYSAFYLRTEAIPYLTPITMDRLQNICFCLYTVSGCLGAWYFANRTFPRINIFFIIYSIAAIFCIAFSPVEYLSQVIFVFFNIAVFIFIGKCATYPFIAYKAKLPETYIIAVIYVIYIPIAFHDAHFMITMEGHPLSPYSAPLTTLAMGAVLALRIARHKKQIERFNQTLSEKVQQAEQKLTSSLGQQHSLALENARLQERINLSHDLHDGLGGSIVRSILLLEQNNQVEKPQVLSMLKLFRNDLRQVIDSGSSIDTKVPQTPIDWGAPIRHRFVQLFEELDIKSKWQFPTTWITPPTAAQCLNLTRVAEETLTNILKHSQATEVVIALTESENQLILHIEDNGIGFDPTLVERGLHVGLHSMKTRISRIGGQFKIDSQAGSTVVQAILPRVKAA